MDTPQGEYSQRATEFEERLDFLIVHIDQLPTLPQILWEIIAQLHDSQNAAADLAAAIEEDPALTINVLHRANSAYYGFAERFVSVKDAVVALGRREVERLVAATLVIDTFGVSGPNPSMNYQAFWIHSLQTAAAAEFISMHHFTISPFIPSEAYLAGLLHDIGKLILSQFFVDDWDAVCAYVAKNNCSVAAAERTVLGQDHGEIAARLMEIWSFPESIIEGTRAHHGATAITKPDGEFVPHADIIALADDVCRAFDAGQLAGKEIHHSQLGMDHKDTAALERTIAYATKRAVILLS